MQIAQRTELIHNLLQQLVSNKWLPTILTGKVLQGDRNQI